MNPGVRALGIGRAHPLPWRSACVAPRRHSPRAASPIGREPASVPFYFRLARRTGGGNNASPPPASPRRNSRANRRCAMAWASRGRCSGVFSPPEPPRRGSTGSPALDSGPNESQERGRPRPHSSFQERGRPRPHSIPPPRGHRYHRLLSAVADSRLLSPMPASRRL